MAPFSSYWGWFDQGYDTVWEGFGYGQPIPLSLTFGAMSDWVFKAQFNNVLAHEASFAYIDAKWVQNLTFCIFEGKLEKVHWCNLMIFFVNGVKY